MAKRRTRGDGGLVQRHDHPTCPPAVNGKRPEHRCLGRWQGTLNATEAGARKRKYVYGRTMKEAKAKLDKAKAQKDAGTLVITTTTMDKWLTRWLELQERRTRREGKGALKKSTYNSYRSKIGTYVRPHLGRHRLTSLRPEHFEAMYDAMRDQGLKESTLRNTHVVLKKVLNDAVLRGLLGANPLARAEAPSTGTGKRTPLTTAEVLAVLDSTDEARWWLALYYGMRQGECLGLRWCDIDWNLTALRVQQTLQDDGREYGKPKTEASQRWIPMVPRIEARMKLHWIESGSPEVAKPCSGVTGICEHGMVFKPVHPRTDNRRWHQLLASVPDIPDVPLHAARNSAASVMEAAGIPDRVVGQILGQTRRETTHGYQFAEMERLRAALVSVDDVLELD